MYRQLWVHKKQGSPGDLVEVVGKKITKSVRKNNKIMSARARLVVSYLTAGSLHSWRNSCIQVQLDVSIILETAIHFALNKIKKNMHFFIIEHMWISMKKYYLFNQILKLEVLGVAYSFYIFFFTMETLRITLNNEFC